MPRIFLAFQKNKKCLPNQTTKLIKPIDPKFRATELKPCRPKKKTRKSRWQCWHSLKLSLYFNYYFFFLFGGKYFNPLKLKGRRQ